MRPPFRGLVGVVGPVVAALASCGGHASVARSTAPAVVAPHVEHRPLPQAQGNPSPTLVDRLKFFVSPTYTQMRISPDGKRVLWIGPRSNVMLPWVGSVDDLRHATMIASDTTRPVTIAAWTTDGKYVLYVQDPNGDGNTHLFRYEVADAKVVDLVPIKGGRVDVLGLGSHRPDIVVVGINDRDVTNDDVYEISIRTGDRKRVIVNDEKLTIMILDLDLEVRFGSKQLPDGTVQLMTYNGKAWSLWDSVSADDRDDVHPITLDRGGTHVLMFDARQRNTAALISFDLKTKQRVVIAEDPRVDVSITYQDPWTGVIGAAGFTDLKTTWRAVDPRMKADIAGLDKLAHGSWQIMSATADGRTWLVAFSDDIQTGEYYLWDRKTHSGRFLVTMTPELDQVSLSHTHGWKLEARDKLVLTAFTTIPHAHDPEDTGIPDAPMPTVLVIPTDNGSRETTNYDQLTQLLANRGYVVLTVNTRGVPGYGKEFTRAGDHEWGGKINLDLEDSVRWAIAQKIADPKKIAVVGENYGGYAAVTALEHAPEMFACGIDILGPLDLFGLARVTPAQNAALFVRQIDDPTTPVGIAHIKALSALDHASRITTPMLVVHSAEKVSGGDTAKLVGNLQHRGVPVSFVLFGDEPTTIARPENNLAMIGVMEAYLSEHLGGFFEPMTDDVLRASSLQVRVGAEGIPGLTRYNSPN